MKALGSILFGMAVTTPMMSGSSVRNVYFAGKGKGDVYCRS